MSYFFFFYFTFIISDQSFSNCSEWKNVMIFSSYDFMGAIIVLCLILSNDNKNAKPK